MARTPTHPGLAREEVGDRVEKLPKLTERKRSKARRAA